MVTINEHELLGGWVQRWCLRGRHGDPDFELHIEDISNDFKKYVTSDSFFRNRTDKENLSSSFIRGGTSHKNSSGPIETWLKRRRR